MATAKELQAQAQAARVAADKALAEAQALADQARAAERAEAAQRRAAAYAEHNQKMFDQFGYDLTVKQHELIYAKAYVDGHSGGYDEVEIHYSDLADLARSVIDAASSK